TPRLPYTTLFRSVFISERVCQQRPAPALLTVRAHTKPLFRSYGDLRVGRCVPEHAETPIQTAGPRCPESPVRGRCLQAKSRDRPRSRDETGNPPRINRRHSRYPAPGSLKPLSTRGNGTDIFLFPHRSVRRSTGS